MRDAIELEWEGIPSVLVVHDALTGSAEAMRKLSGHPDYPYVSFDEPANPSPVTHWEEKMIQELVEELAPRVIERLRRSESQA
jgi:hypothetical protein